MHKSVTSVSPLSASPLNDDKPVSDKIHHHNQNTFKTIFEASPFGNLILSKELIILQANYALLSMLGIHSKNEIEGGSIIKYIHQAHRTDWFLLQQNLCEQQSQCLAFETCMVKGSGSSMWCKVTSILYQENDATLGYIIIEDISKRKKDEDSIKRSEANLLTILDSAESGYVLYNSKLKIVTYNNLAQKFAQLLYSKNLKTGNFLLDYFPQDRHAALIDVTRSVMKGENICYERAMKSPEGEERWMEAKWINVKDHQNKNWGFILASKDITESKLAAIEREKINIELVQRNKALEQFTNITSHNLRAPVANIIGIAELIAEMEMDEVERKVMLDSILLSAKNLDVVITDINDILNIKQAFNERKEKINLQQLVNDIQISISGMILKENATIKCDFDKAENIHGIRSYVYSIFYNMILNSIKYRRSDVDPEIMLTSSVDAGSLKLSFKDNGKGIDLQRNGANLFGLYQRFDSSVQGKGLGLFMVKTQVETLDGTINVSSEPGKGTEFIVEFSV